MSYYFSVMGIYYSVPAYTPSYTFLLHEAREFCAKLNGQVKFWRLAEMTLGLPARLNRCILKVFVVLY